MTTAEESAALIGAPARTHERTLSGKLGVGSIVFMVVAAAAPLTVVGGGFPLGALFGNGVGAPSMYVVGGVILLFFAVGLSTMARFVPKPGAFFTYVGYGLGRPLGLAAAWLAMLTYTTIQVSVYGYIGAVLESSVVSLHGPDAPWFVYAFVVAIVVAVLGFRHIELSGRVLGVLLVCEIAIVLVLAAVIIAAGGADGLSAAPFEPSNVFSGTPAIGLMFALAGFIGFESTAIFRNEAKDPEKTIPRATYTAVILIAVFYTFASWAMVMGWGDTFMAEIGANPSGYIIDTATRYLGGVGATIVNVLLVTSVFACILSFHNVITRYQHSMSNASVLPQGLGKVHARHASPHASSLVQSITAVVFIVAFALFHLDPVLQVFTWFSGIATFAIVVLMALTCLAVIVYFVRNKVQVGAWKRWIAPGIGLIGLLYASYLLATNFPFLLGDVDAKGNPQFGALTIITLIVMTLFPAFGLVQALVLRRSKPDAYENVIDTIGE